MEETTLGTTFVHGAWLTAAALASCLALASLVLWWRTRRAGERMSPRGVAVALVVGSLTYLLFFGLGGAIAISGSETNAMYGPDDEVRYPEPNMTGLAFAAMTPFHRGEALEEVYAYRAHEVEQGRSSLAALREIATLRGAPCDAVRPLLHGHDAESAVDAAGACSDPVTLRWLAEQALRRGHITGASIAIERASRLAGPTPSTRLTRESLRVAGVHLLANRPDALGPEIPELGDAPHELPDEVSWLLHVETACLGEGADCAEALRHPDGAPRSMLQLRPDDRRTHQRAPGLERRVLRGLARQDMPTCSIRSMRAVLAARAARFDGITGALDEATRWASQADADWRSLRDDTTCRAHDAEEIALELDRLKGLRAMHAALARDFDRARELAASTAAHGITLRKNVEALADGSVVLPEPDERDFFARTAGENLEALSWQHTAAEAAGDAERVAQTSEILTRYRASVLRTEHAARLALLEAE